MDDVQRIKAYDSKTNEEVALEEVTRDHSKKNGALLFYMDIGIVHAALCIAEGVIYRVCRSDSFFVLYSILGGISRTFFRLCNVFGSALIWTLVKKADKYLATFEEPQVDDDGNPILDEETKEPVTKTIYKVYVNDNGKKKWVEL